jgi:multidrug transporter EmrE-like cation transporter
LSKASDGFRFSHRQSLALVFFCTFIGAAAQVLIKTGAGGLESRSVWEMVTNIPLLSGYALYGVYTALFSLALRDSELSLLYPIISLTFVWVALLSVSVFHEQMTFHKIVGIGIICSGVALLGSDNKR